MGYVFMGYEATGNYSEQYAVRGIICKEEDQKLIEGILVDSHYFSDLDGGT